MGGRYPRLRTIRFLDAALPSARLARVLSQIVGIEEERRLRARARALAAEAAAAGDESGWFERLYAEAEAGDAAGAPSSAAF
jgi:hypothetical protein